MRDLPVNRTALSVWTAVIAAGIVVVIGGLLVVLVVMPALNRPPKAPPVEPVVEAYLDAVAGGDATAALAMTDVDEGRFDGASTALLDDDVLRAAERIAGPRLQDVEYSGYGDYVAAATVVYTLAGQETGVTMRLEYDEDAKEWRVVDGLLGTVRFEALGGDAIPVEVSGAAPDPDAECYRACGATPAYLLFAGVYDVRADLSGFEIHPDNTTPDETTVTIEPLTSQSVRYLAVPQGDEWPVVDGEPTDPDADADQG